MATQNLGWGAPRIHGELLKLGFEVSQATVSRCMPRRVKPPSQTWRTFLANHVKCTAAVDFFVVPTVTFGLLYVLVVLEHGRRRLVHVNVTEEPDARWTAQQIIHAFPYDSAPQFLLRDRDPASGAKYGLFKPSALHPGDLPSRGSRQGMSGNSQRNSGHFDSLLPHDFAALGRLSVRIAGSTPLAHNSSRNHMCFWLRDRAVLNA